MPHRFITAVMAVLVLGAAGCGDDNSTASGAEEATTPTASSSASGSPASPTDVTGGRTTVSMTDFAFRPKALSAKAGKLRVTAKNDGNAEHELILIRTTRAANAVPREGSRASEAGNVGEIPEQEPGESASHTFTLEPGRYVYICNVPNHYASGMRGTLTVE
jgi:plastocyanin